MGVHIPIRSRAAGLPGVEATTRVIRASPTTLDRSMITYSAIDPHSVKLAPQASAWKTRSQSTTGGSGVEVNRGEDRDVSNLHPVEAVHLDDKLQVSVGRGVHTETRVR